MSCANRTNDRSGRGASRIERRDDKGAVLMFVLVTVLICSLIAIPMLGYIFSVFKAGEVQVNRAQAIEYANGGTWVALSNQDDLYTQCNGGPLTSSIAGVTTTCDVLDTATLRPATEMPFFVASVQAGKTIPAPFNTADTYTNPNTAAPGGNPAAWLTAPDWTKDSTFGKVWLPELPVQTTSSDPARNTFMPPGTQDPGFASCRVFFPGTFTTPITIAEPAYFTSGVYYFTEPIVLKDGANVVVGNGSEVGCTTDFEAIALADRVPDPLNMSGLGGTFVLGQRARITVDDAGTGNVRFAINQRYVSSLETSVAASSDVAIISVNGDHEPFVGAPTLGADLSLDTLRVPASHVGVEGSPLATVSGYLPSVLTPKPTQPDRPTNVVAQTLLASSGTSANRGLVKVTWDVPNANGSIITSYKATDLNGLSCTTTAPAATTVRPSCTISGYQNNQFPRITVVATNAIGPSPASVEVAPLQVKFAAPSLTPTIAALPNPTAATPQLTPHSNGLLASWVRPTTTATQALTTGYRVTATPTLTVLAIPPLTVNTTVVGTPISCEARWDETSCLLPLPTPAPLLTTYKIDVQTLNAEGTPNAPTASTGVTMATLYVWSAGATPAPVKPPATVPARVPEPIVDFTTTTNTGMNIKIDGYVSVPQGRITVAASNPATALVRFTGGVVAAEIAVDPAHVPADLAITFDNPVAQKRLRLTSVYAGKGKATSEAIVQVNRSGSLAVNSWVVQGGDLPPAPIPTTTIPVGTTTTTTVPTSPTTTTPPAPTTTSPPAPTTTTPPPPTTTIPPLVPCADSTKWAASYWTNKALTGTPETQRCENTIDFTWGSGGPGSVNDNYSARWTKTRNFTTTGDYQITIGADDGIRMFIDGVKVYDAFVDKGFSTEVITVPIQAGNRLITVEYYESGGGAQAFVDIAAAPNGINYCSTLPTAYTFDGWGPGDWTAQHWTNTTLNSATSQTVSRAQVNENYGNGSNAVINKSDDFSIRWTRTINVQSTCSVRFRAGGDDGDRLYVDGIKVIDDWGDHSYQTKEATVSLSPGAHTLVFEFYEKGGSARATLEWRKN